MADGGYGYNHNAAAATINATSVSPTYGSGGGEVGYHGRLTLDDRPLSTVGGHGMEHLDEPIEESEKARKKPKTLFERTEDFLRNVQRQQ